MRLQRRPIPSQLKSRQKEILGEIKNNTMIDCVYNEIIAGEYEGRSAHIEADLPGYLKPYQKKDLNKSLQTNMVFNINKPGYGKTLETIMWIKTILKSNFQVLILCPKTVIPSWHQQLNKYWPGWAKAGTWWITNYEQLYNDQRFKLAKEFTWDAIILDESHNIKSFKSKITKICMQLNSRSRHCLTGTPIKNRPEDLAAQLKWLDPYSITNYTDFQFAFCNMRQDAWGYKACGLTKDKTMVDNLQKLLDVYCIGGQEHDIGVVDKPEYIKVRLQLDPKVKALYQKTVGEYDKELKKRVIDTKYLLDQGIKVSNPIEAATRRQQLTSNCQLFDPRLQNVKFEWISDWLNGTDEKVVIFSKFAMTISALEKYLKSKHFTVSAVKRDQSSNMRSAAIEYWKKHAQVLLGTFGVLSEGIDGLQEVCRYTIFVDRDWTASTNEQAEKRLYRTGQAYQPIFYILQAIGTIDITVERVQLDKGADAAQLLDPVTDEEE